jgi:sigma-B regulation protein RsbU (phosphoserine phosphatase)
MAAVNRPARQVGGDYYDALAVDAAVEGGRCLLCVADVSGKGIAASLLMSNVQATLRALLGREATLGELARCTNELLFASTPGNKYVTAILLALDPGTGRCSYVNAGHTEGLLVRADGAIEVLPPTGFALGLFPGTSYGEGGFDLNPGDVVALYSDGVTEAFNPAEEEFGTARLMATLRRSRGASAEEIVNVVLAEIDAFATGLPQHDDLTLMVVRRELEPGASAASFTGGPPTEEAGP